MGFHQILVSWKFAISMLYSTKAWAAACQVRKSSLMLSVSTLFDKMQRRIPFGLPSIIGLPQLLSGITCSSSRPWLPSCGWWLVGLNWIPLQANVIHFKGCVQRDDSGFGGLPLLYFWLGVWLQLWVIWIVLASIVLVIVQVVVRWYIIVWLRSEGLGVCKNLLTYWTFNRHHTWMHPREVGKGFVVVQIGKEGIHLLLQIHVMCLYFYEFAVQSVSVWWSSFVGLVAAWCFADQSC